MSNKTLWLVCATDENFAMPLAVTIYSAIVNLDNSTDLSLHIIENGISPESRQRIERVVRHLRSEMLICWLKVPTNKLKGLKGNGHLSVAAYLRMFIPGLLPPEADRAMYLDCDLLILGNLQILNEMDIEGHALGAVRDFSIATVSHSYSCISDYDELGISPDNPYFNSGVLLLDLRKWRAEKIEQHLTSYILKCGGTMGNADQDALNAILSHDWKKIGYEWNVQGALLYLHEHTSTAISNELASHRTALLRNAKIIHFSGSPKPWHASLNHPYATRWRKSLLLSGWFTPLEAVKWAVDSWLRRALYKILITIGLRKIRERTD